MAEWKQANLGAMLPPEFKDAIGVADAALSTLAPLLTVLGESIGVLASVAEAISVDAFDVASALNQALAVFLEDLKKTGIYYLPVFDGGLDDYMRIQANFPAKPNPDPAGFGFVPPENWTHHLNTFGSDDQLAAKEKSEFAEKFQRQFFSRFAEVVNVVDSKDPLKRIDVLEVPSTGGGVDRFVMRIRTSLDDLGDQNRPTFDTHVSAVVFLIAAPNVTDYYNIMLKLADVFGNMVDTQKIIARLGRIIDQKSWTNPRVDPNFHYSIPPDWSNISFEKLFPLIFSGVDNILKPMAEAMRTGASIAEAIAFLAQTIQKKIATLNRQIEDLNNLVSILDTVLAATGIYALFIDTQEGVQGFSKALKEAALPPELKTLNTIDALVGGFVLLGGSSLAVPMDVFFSGIV